MTLFPPPPVISISKRIVKLSNLSTTLTVAFKIALVTLSLTSITSPILKFVNCPTGSYNQ